MNGTEMKLEPGSHHQLVGGNLVIMSPTKAQDAGVYQCLASNPVGTVVSREAVLRFGCEARPVGCRDLPGEGRGGGEKCPEEAGGCPPRRLGRRARRAGGRTVPEHGLALTPVLQEFSKEERDPVKTHEGWGVMLPCNPPAHYPGEWGPGQPMVRQRAQGCQPLRGGGWVKGVSDARKLPWALSLKGRLLDGPVLF